MSPPLHDPSSQKRKKTSFREEAEDDEDEFASASEGEEHSETRNVVEVGDSEDLNGIDEAPNSGVEREMAETRIGSIEGIETSKNGNHEESNWGNWEEESVKTEESLPVLPPVIPPVNHAQSTQSTQNMQNTTQNMQDTQNTQSQEAGGWGGFGGGWGGWLAGVGGVVENVSKTAWSGLDRVYEALDADHPTTETRSQPQSQEGDSQGLETPKAPFIPRGDVLPSQMATEAAGAVLATLDRTFDTVSDALGHTLLAAYRQTQDLHLTERLSGRDPSTVSGDVAGRGLVVLEGLGRMVGDVVASVRSTSGSQARSNSLSSKSASAPSFLGISVKSLFDDVGGAHLQALQMLSTESQFKISSAPPRQLQNSDEPSVDAILNAGSILEEAESTFEAADAPSLASTQAQNDLLFLFDRIGVSNCAPRLALMGNLLTLSTGHKTLPGFHSALAKNLSTYVSKTLEQLLRISEVLLMRIGECKLSAAKTEDGMPSVEYAKVIRKFGIQVCVDLMQLRQGALDFCETLATEVHVTASASERAPGEVDASEEIVRTRSSVNSSTDFCLSKVNEGIQATASILNLLTVTMDSR